MIYIIILMTITGFIFCFVSILSNIELIEEIQGISKPFLKLLKNDKSIDKFYYNIRESD